VIFVSKPFMGIPFNDAILSFETGNKFLAEAIL
jgi:hypothetical protein